MRQLLRRFGGSIGLCCLVWATAQAQASAPWPTTRLDSVASVQMPYEGTIDESAADLGLLVYTTVTSDNRFDVVVITPKSARPLRPGTILVPNAERFVYDLMRIKGSYFTHPKLKYSHLITLPSVSNRQAMHQVYSGFSEVYQEPAVLELTWVVVDATLYVFRCSSLLPEAAGAAEDMKHFFSTIQFSTFQP